MFISKDFPGTPIGLIYKITGKYFTIVAILIQTTLPFYTVLGIEKIIRKLLSKEEKGEVYKKEN